MHKVPLHISHFVRQVMTRNTHYPPLAHALLSLPARTYKTFRQLVIPTKEGITTLEWVVIRYDCVFLIEGCQEDRDDHPTHPCLHDQWNTTRQKGLDLGALLRQVHYTGVVQPVLVTLTPQVLDVAGDPPILDISGLPAYLNAYIPVRRVTKPAYAMALCRAVEKAMYARRYRNLAPLRNRHRLENYDWMRDFKPPVIRSSQRDFAFRQALQPQAVYRTDKGK